ncbi:MAG: (d)CMP kinase [Clostridiales bacterium]|jgi:cytidylate kinase|nr:(d)CMP kinase [Clostridiales bacterium]
MINITIDGPSGAGKSTVAKSVAKRIGIMYLDTGALYRAFAYFSIKNGVDVNDENAVEMLLGAARIDVKHIGGEQRVFCDGLDVTPYIREHNISKAASDISKHQSVRVRLSEIQRKIAGERDVVLDGRDAGTFVLPNANYKFYLTANPEVRARRRYSELKEKGADVEYAKVLEDIKLRDYNDSNRAFAPLKQAPDARLIDSTDMSAQEVADIILQYVNG